MYHPQQPHGAGGPWAAPSHHIFPGGDHAYVPHQHHARAPPAPPTELSFPPPPGAVHGRPQPQLDAVDFRRKEEQRRRQHEYSQALAEQVRQREQQKQHEKDARRREDAAFDAVSGAHHHGAGPQAAQPDRGLFDGLGQHNPNQRTNFGRGRREPAVAPSNGAPPGMNPMAGGPLPPPQSHPHYHHQQQHQQQQQQQAPYYHQAPGHELHQPPQHQVAWSGHAEALGLVEPPHHFGDPQAPQQGAPWHPHQNFPPPQQTQPYQEPVPAVAGGRRARSDLHDGGGVGVGGANDGDARKQQRLQQQLDMQESLRRQIEDKQRQKLEEKRKREEDERREMEKFEQEKRRQHDEQERLKDEKRRKAQAEEAHFRAQQQQLAAAAAAAQEQRQQRLHHSPPKPSCSAMPPQQLQESPPQMRHANAEAMHPQHQSPPRMHHAQPPVAHPRRQNPFTNSRAHLFEDSPRSPQHQHQQQSLSPHPHHHHPMHGSPVAPLDSRRLLEQYEQVRAELERQRQLVEQLHAQMQQQQRHARDDDAPRDLPTVSDLERLRQELHDELAHREVQHRQELEALRRHHQQQQHQQQRKSHEPPRPSVDKPLQHEKRCSPPKRTDPQRRGPGRRHDAFVQDALREELEDEETLETSVVVNDHRDTNNNNNRRRPSPTGSLQRSLLGSLSATSLQCESKLVFFDGRVHDHQEPPVRGADHDASHRKEDESVDKRLSSRSVMKRATDNQHETGYDYAPPASNAELSEDDGFFVRRVERRELEPERYRSELHSSGARLAAPSILAGSRRSHERWTTVLDVGDGDDEDEDDDTNSLDGDVLEAIFQRNLRRHEILAGFEAAQRGSPQVPGVAHWEELHRRLRTVPREVAPPTKGANEPSLAASSRWMPSPS